MNEIFRKYLIRLIIVAFLLAGAGFLLFTRVWPHYYFSAFPALILFFVAVNAVVQYYLLKARDDRPEKFPRVTMAVNGIKIFTYLVFLATYLLLNRQEPLPFLVSFLLMYFVFTIVQTVHLQKEVRKGNYAE